MSHFLIHTNYNIKDNHVFIKTLIFRTSFSLKRIIKLIKIIKHVVLISIKLHKMLQKAKYCSIVSKINNNQIKIMISLEQYIQIKDN